MNLGSGRGYDLVAVPSYRRPQTCTRDTLATLLAGRVPANRIQVWVGGGEQADEYRAALPDPAIAVRTAPVGVVAAHNTILADAPAGARVVCCDDDLRGVRVLTAPHTLTPAANLDALFSAAFTFCRRAHVSLWGLAPTTSALYMRPRWHTGLFFALGQCFGMVVDHAHRLTAPAKEDYERTLMHFQHAGAVARLDDHVAVTRPMRTYPGGNQAAYTDRRAAERAAVAMLRHRWPALVHQKPDRDGYPEIALRLPAQQTRKRRR